MYIERKAELVQTWGFVPVSEILFKRESNIAIEQWCMLDADKIQVLDKRTNQVAPYQIEWSLFK